MEVALAHLIITPDGPFPGCVLPIPRSLGFAGFKVLSLGTGGEAGGWARRLLPENTGRRSSTEFKAMSVILSFGAPQTDEPTSKERSCHTGGATDPG